MTRFSTAINGMAGLSFRDAGHPKSTQRFWNAAGNGGQRLQFPGLDLIVVSRPATTTPDQSVPSLRVISEAVFQAFVAVSLSRQHPLHDAVAVNEEMDQRRRHMEADQRQQRPFQRLVPAVDKLAGGADSPKPASASAPDRRIASTSRETTRTASRSSWSPIPAHRAASARLPNSAAASGQANSRAPRGGSAAMRTAARSAPGSRFQWRHGRSWARRASCCGEGPASASRSGIARAAAPR